MHQLATDPAAKGIEGNRTLAPNGALVIVRTLSDKCGIWLK
jgi:hypothetical protein